MGVSYTEEQEACVKSLIGPVDVSAGAGSGKTFTLTQRIVHALEDPNSGVDDIDQVCAITFTEKAASELKGRIRSTLRARGLFDQALKVDSAWISTIHGMCSRILRTQALDLGLDPSFTVLGQNESDALLAEVLDFVLAEDAKEKRQFVPLTQEFPVASTGFGLSLTDLVGSILNASLGLPDGPLGLKTAAASEETASALARQLLDAYEDMAAVLEAYKPGKQRDEALDQAGQARVALTGFLQGNQQTFAALWSALDSCKVLRKFTAKDLVGPSEEYRQVHYRVVRLASMAKSSDLLQLALLLAQRVGTLLDVYKRSEGTLDNNDLIALAARAMENPVVAQNYVDRFRLIMVDEFQDTDQLQLSLVRRMAGPGMRYLCTVGDAQQSIYGFRGADIAVYRAYQRQLQDESLLGEGARPSQLKLSRNFRSHQDVLSFVKAVCAQRQVFGQDFLDLSATYDGSKYRSAEPRIQLAVSAAAVGKGDGSRISDARAVQASQIASYFLRMKQAGHSLSDMVLLLGSTTQASLYAAEIRSKVGPCVIAGGSLFCSAPEVDTVKELMLALANPLDTESLFRVLSSPAFALDASDYLALSTYCEDGLNKRRPLDEGLAELGRLALQGNLPGVSAGLAHAVYLLAQAQKDLRQKPFYQVVLDVCLQSGWLSRLEGQGAEGLSVAGNILKAVRLLEDLEAQSAAGPSCLAREFAARLDGLKETPGALNAGGQEAIRIMTIHASKGLEFPIVALADFDASPSSEAFVARKVEGVAHVSLRLSGEKLAGQDQLSAAFAALADELCPPTINDLSFASPDVFHAVLAQEAAQADREERQRLFYVGATRAKEALCVFLALKPNKDGDLLAQEGLAYDLQSALFAGEGYPAESGSFAYGADQAGDYRVAFASAADVASEDTQEKLGPGSILAPVFDPPEPIRCAVPPAKPTGIVSYSALDQALDHETMGAALSVPAQTALSLSTFDQVDQLDEMDAGPVRRLASDADKATAFGSAFHRLAQVFALAGADAARDALSSVAQFYGVGDCARLDQALKRWVSSKECARAFAYESCKPEVAFCLPVGQGFLEGAIDLLCTHASNKEEALVIDYKTGGWPSETLEALTAKHGLQARCYAAAVLSQGYKAVELVFYRVEQGNAVTFSFTQDQLPDLLSALDDVVSAAEGSSASDMTS